MASDKNDKGKAEEQAKTLSSSNMDPDELAKAIEQSVAHEDKAKSSKTSSKAKSKTTKDTPQAKAGNEQPEEPEEASPKQEKSGQDSKDDGGVPIIVKRRSGYVQPRISSGGDAKSQEEEPLEPPSKTQKVVTPKLEGDTKETQNPEPKLEEETPATGQGNKPSDDTNQSPQKESEASEEEEPSASKSVGAEKEEPKKPKEEEETKTTTQSPQTEEPKQDTETLQGTEDPTKEEPQKPTVFDTTEYHLPIKARNRKYVNSAAAWVVLLLAIAIAAGYVLYRLGALEIGDLNILS